MAGNSVNLDVEGREEKRQEFWELLDNQSLPPLRCCIKLLPFSPARKMSQVCAGRRRNLNHGSPRPEVWKGAHTAALFSLQEPWRALDLGSPTSWHDPAQGSQPSHSLVPTEQSRASLARYLPFPRPADQTQSQADWRERVSVRPGVSWTGGCESGVPFSRLWQRGSKLPRERKNLANGAVAA